MASDWRRNVLWNLLLQCVTQFHGNSAVGITNNTKKPPPSSIILPLSFSFLLIGNTKAASTLSTLWSAYIEFFFYVPDQYEKVKMRCLQDVRFSEVHATSRIKSLSTVCIKHLAACILYSLAACGAEWSFSIARDEVGARSPWPPDADLRYSLPDGYCHACLLESVVCPSDLKCTNSQIIDQKINGHING